MDVGVSGGGGGSNASLVGSKLSKLYARRQLLGQSGNSNNLDGREQHVYAGTTDAGELLSGFLCFR